MAEGFKKSSTSGHLGVKIRAAGNLYNLELMGDSLFRAERIRLGDIRFAFLHLLSEDDIIQKTSTGGICMSITAITIIAMIVSVAICACHVLKGIRRGTINSLVRLASIVVAIVAAYLLSFTVCDFFTDMVHSKIYPTLQARLDLPSIESFSWSYIQNLLNPFVFVGLFFLLQWLLGLATIPIRAILLPLKALHLPGNRLLGGVIGGISGILIVSMFLMPFCNSVHYANETLEQFSAFDVVQENAQSITEFAEECDDSLVVRINQKLTSGLYNKLTGDLYNQTNAAYKLFNFADVFGRIIDEKIVPDEKLASELFSNLNKDSIALVSATVSDFSRTQMTDNAALNDLTGDLTKAVLTELMNNEKEMTPQEFAAESLHVLNAIECFVNHQIGGKQEALEMALKSSSVADALLDMPQTMRDDLKRAMSLNEQEKEQSVQVLNNAQGTVSAEVLNIYAEILCLDVTY